MTNVHPCQPEGGTLTRQSRKPVRTSVKWAFLNRRPVRRPVSARKASVSFQSARSRTLVSQSNQVQPGPAKKFSSAGRKILWSYDPMIYQNVEVTDDAPMHRVSRQTQCVPLLFAAKSDHLSQTTDISCLCRGWSS